MNLCINATRMNSSAYTVTWLLKWYKVILILFTTSLQQQELISSVSSTGPNRPGARAYSLFMSHKFAPNCIYVVFFAFRCQKRLSASRVMVSNIWSVFFFFQRLSRTCIIKVLWKFVWWQYIWPLWFSINTPVANWKMQKNIHVKRWENEPVFLGYMKPWPAGETPLLEAIFKFDE